MPQLPPGGTGFAGGDPVLWAKLPPGGQSHTDTHTDGRHDYAETWLVRCGAPNVSTAVVRASTRIPAEGFALYQHVPADNPLLNGTYMRAVDQFDQLIVRDPDAVVVSRDVRATDDPYYFEVVVSYAGVDDPTAEPPEVACEEVTYQEFLTYDVNGKPVMNSAFDPIDGGMPTEGFLKRVTITRNLPWASWHWKKADGFRKTLNAKPFVYPNVLNEFGGPVQESTGTVLLDSVREQRVLRRRGVGTANEYYWRITAELLIDTHNVRFSNGTTQLRGHQFVVPDAGYNEFGQVAAGPPVKWGKRAIRPDAAGSSTPQLLNGKGQALMPRGQQVNEITFNPHLAAAPGPRTSPDYYATAGGTTLTVSAANGVLANDARVPPISSVVQVGSGSERGGTVTLNSDGSFTFTPAAGFFGWDQFFYKPTGAADADKVAVQILVGPIPVLLFFDKYRMKDWSPLAALLEGW